MQLGGFSPSLLRSLLLACGCELLFLSCFFFFFCFMLHSLAIRQGELNHKKRKHERKVIFVGENVPNKKELIMLDSSAGFFSTPRPWCATFQEADLYFSFCRRRAALSVDLTEAEVDSSDRTGLWALHLSRLFFLSFFFLKPSCFCSVRTKVPLCLPGTH